MGMEKMTHHEMARAIANALDMLDLDAKRHTIASAIEIVTGDEMTCEQWVIDGGNFDELVADVRVARRLRPRDSK